MKISIITIFPDYFSPLSLSLLGKAQRNNLVEFEIINLRSFAPMPHHNVDDTPFGGGPGMVMKPDVLFDAIESTRKPDSLIVFTSPAGVKFNQQVARNWSSNFENIIFICGRFEGYDDRIVRHYQKTCGEEKVLEVSIGDFVLFGGEVATLSMIEAIVRLIPGVVGNPESLVEESHELNENDEALLEYPNFTRPQNFMGLEVPNVLLSGNHQLIANWRKEQSILRTNNHQKK